MNQIVTLVIGMEMAKKMRAAQTIQRASLATTVEEKTAVVQETEKFVFEVTNEIVKQDSELDENGIEMKKEFLQQILAHQYIFFELPNPFENGTTFEEVQARNGIEVAPKDLEEFFTN